MYLTDLQKQIVNKINSGHIQSINDFIRLFLTSDINTFVKGVTIYQNLFYFQNFYEQGGKYNDYIGDTEINIRKLKEYKFLIKKLQKVGLVDVEKNIRINAETILIAKLIISEDRKTESLKVFHKIMNEFADEYFSFVKPNIDLDFFVKNGYYTEDEMQHNEVIEITKRSNRNTIIATSVIFFITIIFNILTYKTDRSVTILNPKDTSYIKLTSLPIADTVIIYDTIYKYVNDSLK